MLDTISMAKRLSGEYKETFEWIDIYSTPLDMTEEIKDEKIMELYDLLVEAEHNNKPIDMIVGKNLEMFCKNFFESHAKKSRMKEILNSLFRISLVFFVFSIIDFWLAEDKIDLLPFAVGLTGGLVCDVLAKCFLQPLALKKKMKPICYYFLIIGFFLFAVVIVGIVTVAIKAQLEIDIWIIWLVTGGYVVVYWTLRSILRYRHHSNIFNEKKESKKAIKAFNKEVQNASATGIIVTGMAKRFKRIRNRKRKKKIDYTFTDFAQLIRKERISTTRLNVCVCVFIALMVLIPGIDIIIDETILDGLIFMTFMGVFEFFICRWMIRINNDMTSDQIRIIEECESREIDILQYEEELHKTIDE